MKEINLYARNVREDLRVIIGLIESLVNYDDSNIDLAYRAIRNWCLQLLAESTQFCELVEEKYNVGVWE